MKTTSTAVRYDVVRESALAPVRDDLVELMNATRSRTVEAGRFDWLYEQNPDGRAVTWTLRKSDTGEAVGFTSCLPRRMLVNGEVLTAWIGSDFSVQPRYRTLGLASKLRRAAREAIDAGEADFLYAHPNDRMAMVHERAGHSRVGLMQRYARLLRTGPILEERFKSQSLSRMGAAVLDPLLAVSDPEKRSRRRFQVQRHADACFDERFDRLFETEAEDNVVLGVRDALYLNWRYGTNPLYRSELLTACEGDRLMGYLIFTREEDGLVIKDIFPAQDANVVRDLLAEVTWLGRESRLRSATFIVFEHHPLVPVLTQFGYRPRAEQSQMFTYVPARMSHHECLQDSPPWRITVGDRDV